jgi:hypothetical protein
MSVDFQRLVLDPNYRIHGVPARLVMADTSSADLTVIDETAGAIFQQSGGGGFAMPTTKPAAAVRLSELQSKSIAAARLARGTLTFRPGTLQASSWRIEGYESKPAGDGNGAASGELLLTLIRIP